VTHETKGEASKETTFDALEIRIGRITNVEPSINAPKRAYRLTIDFGKFGIRTSVGRFTTHEASTLNGLLVVGVLNFPPRRIGDSESTVLVLGVQVPGAESGEATFLTPLNPEAKIGGKVF